MSDTQTTKDLRDEIKHLNKLLKVVGKINRQLFEYIMANPTRRE